MITSVQFKNFKTLENYSVSLDKVNILVGPNNAGKSSILDAFRILHGAYRSVSRKNPGILAGGRCGYIVSASSIPIAIEHVHTNYNDLPAVLTYRFGGGKAIQIEFSKSGLITLETLGAVPKTAKSFRDEFPLQLYVMPTLGPLENEESIYDSEYVKHWSESHRASRFFRNIWVHEADRFDEFRKLVESTWPGMSISPPEIDWGNQRVSMFCRENHIDREVCWAGYGFQIWLQLLTHIVRAQGDEMIVVDEPEIYLHPDLQRKVVSVLKRFVPQVIVATHSVELINEAELEDILVVEKSARSAKRLSDVAGLRHVAELLGSNQNIQLTRVARSKRVLFVEGDDRKFLSRLLALAGVAETDDISYVPLGGYSQWERIGHAEWVFTDILGQPMRAAALFDRDYRCDEEVAELTEALGKKIGLVHILKRKEIENYLLVPRLLDAVIKRQLANRRRRDGSGEPKDYEIYDLLDEVTQQFKEHVKAQRIAHKMEHKPKWKDNATFFEEESSAFEEAWKNIDNRICMVPGKQALSKLNAIIQDRWHITASTPLLLANMKREDLCTDLRDFLSGLVHLGKIVPSESVADQ